LSLLKLKTSIRRIKRRIEGDYMFSKTFIQTRTSTILKQVRDRFGKTIGLIMPLSKTGNENRTKTWNVIALVTYLSHKDNRKYAIENMEYRTVDVFVEDIETLSADNPSAYIVSKNFKNKISVQIDGKIFKIRDEILDQGFENTLRFICERSTMS
jgi:hypothetical protein